jgi:hypothetical protein
MKSLRLAALLGTITGAALITITLPELLDNVGILSIIGYTVGVFILTCKLNTVYRKGN